MRDAFGREINYLRLSLTDRCNFRCRYCMPAKGVPMVRHDEMLTLEELFSVVRLMAGRLGFTKVRVTGGEPLVRRGAVPFLKSLHVIPQIQDLSLTTNAYHLAPVAAELHRAGYARINISLDTLQRERFQSITGVDGLEQVLAGIDAARAAGFDPIKLNAVALQETCDEVLDLVAFSIERRLHVRFIELMPVRGGAELHFVPNDRIREIIESRFQLMPLLPSDGASAPVLVTASQAAVVYRIAGTASTCGFISSMSHPFCAGCNRVRLGGGGELKPCLASPVSYSIMPYVRPNLREDELEAHLRRIIAAKKHSRGDYEIDSMSRFGG